MEFPNLLAICGSLLDSAAAVEIDVEFQAPTPAIDLGDPQVALIIFATKLSCLS